VTKSLYNYHLYKTTDRWCSVDPHLQNGAVPVLLSLLPIKTANTSVRNNSDQITVWLPYLHIHKSLTLSWHWFWWIVHSIYAAIDNSFHYILNFLVVFLTDWDLALWESRAQYHSFTVLSYTTKIYVSCQKLHCACYISVYQPVFTSYCSAFAD